MSTYTPKRYRSLKCITPGCGKAVQITKDTKGLCQECFNAEVSENFKRKMAELRGHTYAPSTLPDTDIPSRKENTRKNKSKSRSYLENPSVVQGICANKNLFGRKLTRKEKQVVELLCRGKTRREIAEEIQTNNPNNISNFLRKVVQKWGLRYKEEIVPYAILMGEVNVTALRNHYSSIQQVRANPKKK